MTFEDIKTAILGLSSEDQKRLITEIVPQLWQSACTDKACLAKMRELVDEETVKSYREQHMDAI